MARQPAQRSGPRARKGEMKKDVSKVMSASALCARIANDVGGVKPIVVKRMLKALQIMIAREVRNGGAFKVHALAIFKVRFKPATEARMKKMFGKEVQVKAKPAAVALKAFPTKSLKDAVMEARGV